ncbi:MAG: asparagine synthase (glutamine-hydrolyzing) [Deltaproteobacteria bacterium]|nr:asparagine synthase (glutamine-hydrolyzing) [Deltaproteobacteria bacterium]
MCGIVGFFAADGIARPAAEALLRTMLGTLHHRGPDGEGQWIATGERPWAGLGTRRLGLVDLDGGDQPRADQQGRYVLSHNGELYNHKRLAEELRADGVLLRGRSDTEAWVQLMGHYGVEPAIDRADGMFAAAIADTLEREVTLVRDRMGKKPLYLTRTTEGVWLWASEPRALLAAPGVNRTVDQLALQRLLLWEYIPGPGSAWAHIHKLEAGTALRLRAGSRRRYWTLPTPQEGAAGDGARWARSLRASLDVAVGRRLEADVPCALLLSGGLDSSAVAALAAARRPGLDAFHVQVDAPGFDESAAAAVSAQALGLKLRSLRLKIDDLDALFDEATAHMDEPLADSSLLSTWHLMRGVAEAGFRCALSGDGADELFAGYPTVRAHQLAPMLEATAPLLRAVAARAPTTWGGVSWDFKLRAMVDGLGEPWARRHQRWMGAWSAAEIGAPDEVFAPVDAIAAHTATRGAARALLLDQQLYMREGVLVKVDRASMAHGVEVRSPFLDTAVVQLAADIGLGHKLRGHEGKVVLREAVAGLLPAAVLHQRKRGFGSPIGPWLRGPGGHRLDALPDQLADLVRPETMRAVIAAHRTGARDHRRRLFSALSLAAWRARWA